MYRIEFGIFSFLHSQKSELIEHIEKLTFWAGDNEKLHFAKQELFSQISHLEFSITGNGYFLINRKSLANVSFSKPELRSGHGILITHSTIAFQMASACCTYIVIFIQISLTGRT